MSQKRDLVKCLQKNLPLDTGKWTLNDINFSAGERAARKACEQIMSLMKAIDESQRGWKHKYLQDANFEIKDVPDELVDTVNEDYPLAIEWLMDTARQCMRTAQYGKAKVMCPSDCTAHFLVDLTSPSPGPTQHHILQ